MQLSSEVKLTKVEDHTAAGTTDVDSASVDMAGFEGVLFLTSFGTAATNNYISVQTSSDDGSADTFTDLTGTKVGATASDEDVWVDVLRPRERYLRVHVELGTSSTVESIWAIQYGPRKLPVDNTTTGTIIGEAWVSPAEGTA